MTCACVPTRVFQRDEMRQQPRRRRRMEVVMATATPTCACTRSFLFALLITLCAGGTVAPTGSSRTAAFLRGGGQRMTEALSDSAGTNSSDLSVTASASDAIARWRGRFDVMHVRACASSGLAAPFSVLASAGNASLSLNMLNCSLDAAAAVDLRTVFVGNARLEALLPADWKDTSSSAAASCSFFTCQLLLYEPLRVWVSIQAIAVNTTIDPVSSSATTVAYEAVTWIPVVQVTVAAWPMTGSPLALQLRSITDDVAIGANSTCVANSTQPSLGISNIACSMLVYDATVFRDGMSLYALNGRVRTLISSPMSFTRAQLSVTVSDTSSVTSSGGFELYLAPTAAWPTEADAARLVAAAAVNIPSSVIELPQPFVRLSSATLTLGGRACILTTLLSAALIRCVAPPRDGINLDVNIVNGQSLGARNSTMLYYSTTLPTMFVQPVVTSIAPSAINLPRTTSMRVEPSLTYPWLPALEPPLARLRSFTLSGARIAEAGGCRLDAVYIGGVPCSIQNCTGAVLVCTAWNETAAALMWRPQLQSFVGDKVALPVSVSWAGRNLSWGNVTVSLVARPTIRSIAWGGPRTGGTSLTIIGTGLISVDDVQLADTVLTPSPAAATSSATPFASSSPSQSASSTVSASPSPSATASTSTSSSVTPSTSTTASSTSTASTTASVSTTASSSQSCTPLATPPTNESETANATVTVTPSATNAPSPLQSASRAPTLAPSASVSVVPSVSVSPSAAASVPPARSPSPPNGNVSLPAGVTFAPARAFMLFKADTMSKLFANVGTGVYINGRPCGNLTSLSDTAWTCTAPFIDVATEGYPSLPLCVVNSAGSVSRCSVVQYMSDLRVSWPIGSSLTRMAVPSDPQLSPMTMITPPIVVAVYGNVTSCTLTATRNGSIWPLSGETTRNNPSLNTTSIQLQLQSSNITFAIDPAAQYYVFSSVGVPAPARSVIQVVPQCADVDGRVRSIQGSSMLVTVASMSLQWLGGLPPQSTIDARTSVRFTVNGITNRQLTACACTVAPVSRIMESGSLSLIASGASGNLTLSAAASSQNNTHWSCPPFNFTQAWAGLRAAFWASCTWLPNGEVFVVASAYHVDFANATLQWMQIRDVRTPSGGVDQPVYVTINETVPMTARLYSIISNESTSNASTLPPLSPVCVVRLAEDVLISVISSRLRVADASALPDPGSASPNSVDISVAVRTTGTSGQLTSIQLACILWNGATFTSPVVTLSAAAYSLNVLTPLPTVYTPGDGSVASFPFPVIAVNVTSFRGELMRSAACQLQSVTTGAQLSVDALTVQSESGVIAFTGGVFVIAPLVGVPSVTARISCRLPTGDAPAPVSWTMYPSYIRAAICSRPDRSTVTNGLPLPRWTAVVHGSIPDGADPCITPSTLPRSVLNTVQCTLAPSEARRDIVIQGAVSRPGGVDRAQLIAFEQTSIAGTPGATYDLRLTCRVGLVEVYESEVARVTPPSPTIITATPLSVVISIDACTAGSVPKGSQCSMCEPGTYSLGGADVICHTCPSQGVSCVNGIISLLPGFFRPPQEAGLLTAQSQLLSCALPQACVVNASVFVSAATNASVDVRGTYTCAPGYIGPLCGVCAPGFAYFGKVCAPCDDGIWTHERRAVLLGALVLLVCAGLWYMGRPSGRAQVGRKQSSIMLRITLSYVQALLSITLFMSGAMRSFRSLFGYAESASASPLSLGPLQCITGLTASQQYFFVALAPLWAPALTIVETVAVMACRHVRDRNAFHDALRHWWQEKTPGTVVIFVLFLLYPNIVSSSLRMLDAYATPIAGQSWLNGDLREKFLVQTHAVAYAVAIIMLLVVGVGVPLFVFVRFALATPEELVGSEDSAPMQDATSGDLDRLSARLRGLAAPCDTSTEPEIVRVNPMAAKRRLQEQPVTASSGKQASLLEHSPAAGDRPHTVMQHQFRAFWGFLYDGYRIRKTHRPDAVHRMLVSVAAFAQWVLCGITRAPLAGAAAQPAVPPVALANVPNPMRSLNSAGSTVVGSQRGSDETNNIANVPELADDGHAVWWEAVILLRKLLLTLTGVLVKDKFVNLVLLSLLFTFFTLLQILVAPYEMQRFNHLESLGLMMCTLTSVMSAWFLSPQPEAVLAQLDASSAGSATLVPTSADTTIASVLVFLNGCLCIGMAWQYVRFLSFEKQADVTMLARRSMSVIASVATGARRASVAVRRKSVAVQLVK